MYKVILALRYLFHHRITYFAVVAVALCVFIVVVVMTVMTGLVGDFKQKNHDFVGDCVVGTESLVGFAYYEDLTEKLEGCSLVERVSPVVRSYGLLNPSGRELYVPVELIGVDPVRHSGVTGFGESLYYHRAEVSRAFEPEYDPNLLGCVLGIDLAMERDSQSRYAHGSSPLRVAFVISCVPLSARGAPAKDGMGLVSSQTFHYSDDSHSGLARVDNSVVYVALEQAQLLCGMGGAVKRISAVHVKFKSGVDLESGCSAVGSVLDAFKESKGGEDQGYLLDTVKVQSWREYRRGFIAAMEKEQAVMTVMFGFVGITTVFIVFVVFYMIISHKRRDIGILKSVGASNGDILALFSGFAFMVGLLGSFLGILGGYFFLGRLNRVEDWLFNRFGFQLWDRTIYAIGDIPSRTDPVVLLVIAFCAVAACIVGAFFPSRQASRSEPAEIL